MINKNYFLLSVLITLFIIGRIGQIQASTAEDSLEVSATVNDNSLVANTITDGQNSMETTEPSTITVNIDDLVVEPIGVEVPNDTVKETINEFNATDVVIENDSLISLENETNISSPEYVSLDELVPLAVDTLEKNVSPPLEKVQKSLFKDGKVELEFEINEGQDIEIDKKELIKSDFEKIVRISSTEHFGDSLRAYSDLPTQTNKENINIVWNDEDVKVSGIEYYDEDGNGLIDRVSWIVPHLSTQTYTITIGANSISNSSISIAVSIGSPLNVNGTNVSNPLVFPFSVDYVNSSLVNCYLTLDGNVNSSILALVDNSSQSIPLNLTEGMHNWMFSCNDASNLSIYSSLSGTFNVVDKFNLSIGPIYMRNDNIAAQLIDSGANIELILQNPSGSNVSLGNQTNVVNSSYLIPSSNFPTSGTYTLYAKSYYYSTQAYLSKTFYVGDVKIGFDNTVELGENMSFSLKFNSSMAGTYDLYVGGKRIVNDRSFNSGINQGETIYYNQQVVGNNQQVIVETTINGRTINNTLGNIDVSSTSGDNIDPSVSLDFPGWEETIGTSDITFRYKAYDNIGIKNCSLSIYNTTKSGSGVYEAGDLLFPITSSDKSLALKNSPTNNQSIETRLVEFEEGSYIWEVECFDDAGNKDWNFNYFDVSLNSSTVDKKATASSYDREQEVNDLIDSINGYLEQERQFGPEEQRVVELLEISKNMNLDKKQLIQMNQDLKYNLKFMEEEKRKTREREINLEIDRIKSEVVKSVVLTNNYEYTKNSIDTPIEEIIKNYLSQTSKEDPSNSMVKFNEDLQGKLSYNTKVWEVKINYFDSDKTILLVEKEIDSGDFNGQILEVIPNEFGKPTFLNQVKEIGQGIYEFYKEDLKEGSLIYYFDEGSSKKDIKSTETVLFKGEVSSGGGLTGFFVSVGDSGISIISIILGILFIGYVGIWGVGRITAASLKGEGKGREMFELIKKTKEDIKSNRVDSARDNYSKMNGLYRELSSKGKGFFLRELTNILDAINKKDVMNLVKEYEKAKEEYRKEDAHMLYSKINQVYKKLPKKFQEKVYTRIIKKKLIK